MGRAGRPPGNDLPPELRELYDEGLPEGWGQYWHGRRTLDDIKEEDGYEQLRFRVATDMNASEAEVWALPEMILSRAAFEDNISFAVERYIARLADTTKGVLEDTQKMGVPLSRIDVHGASIEIANIDILREHVLDLIASRIDVDLRSYERELLEEAEDGGSRKITALPPEQCSSCRSYHAGDDCSVAPWSGRDYHYVIGEGVAAAPPRLERWDEIHCDDPMPDYIDGHLYDFEMATDRQDAWKTLRARLASEIDSSASVADLPEMQEARDELIESLRWTIDTYARRVAWSTENSISMKNRFGVLLHDGDSLEVLSMEYLREQIEMQATATAQKTIDDYQRETIYAAERGEIEIVLPQPPSCPSCRRHHRGDCRSETDQRKEKITAAPVPDPDNLRRLQGKPDGTQVTVEGDVYTKEAPYWRSSSGYCLNSLQIARLLGSRAVT